MVHVVQLMLTPIGSNESGAIAVVAFAGLEISAPYGWLRNTHRIVATPLVHEEFNGLRVTPSVYTTLDEVDRFAETVIEAMSKGIA